MSMTEVAIDDRILAVLRERRDNPGRAIEEAVILELFRHGAISRGRAAELLGIDLLAFLRLASDHQISVIEL